MAQLPPFPTFDLRAADDNNIGLEWAKWVERFENFLIACNITEAQRKKALLLHYVGEEIYDLFRSLPEACTQTVPSTSISTTTQQTTATQATQETSTSEYDAAKAKLDAYLAPRVNPTFAVYRFRQAQQNDGESLDAFYARLRELSRHCNFSNVDIEIKNQLILATTSSRLRKYAMLHSLDLSDILKQGRLFEEIERDVSEIERNTESAAPVNALHKHLQHGKRAPTRDKEAPQHNRDSSTICGNCGDKWPHDGGKQNCPA
ncbi:uncharacterized protein LOC135397437 [Ornithodoros turicata]|uniref:uncharacterized protein LOC135397437 n=1 Tax=Ornithodoros turicata TaxID=34597 RepID=UPI0031398552